MWAAGSLCVCLSAAILAVETALLTCSCQRWIAQDCGQTSSQGYEQGQWEPVALKIVDAGSHAEQEVKGLQTVQEYLQRKEQETLQAGGQPKKPHILSLLNSFHVSKDFGDGNMHHTYLVTRWATALVTLIVLGIWCGYQHAVEALAY